MFRLVSEVIFGKTKNGELAKVGRWHSSLLKNRQKLIFGSHGAGSHAGNAEKRRISSLVRYSSVRPRYGRLLFRLASYFQPAEILELGTGVGVSAAYLHTGAPLSRMTTVEGAEQKSAFARQEFLKNGFPETEFVQTRFDEFLSGWKPAGQPLMIFLDGDHAYEATMKYYKQILTYAGHDTILILDDIHWSDDMERAWSEIKGGKKPAFTADLFFMGIVFFREGIIGQNFMINF